jgi:hypothetical protein
MEVIEHELYYRLSADRTVIGSAVGVGLMLVAGKKKR